jgi:Lipocalin-like domain
MEVREARMALVGVWRLLSYADRSAVEEPWESTFGSDPRGLIVYHSSGLMSVQVAAAPGDDAAPWRYVGYLGTFDVQEADRHEDKIVGIVLHHMDVAYPPELLDEEPERDFQVEGDALMLGDGLTARRVLERIG